MSGAPMNAIEEFASPLVSVEGNLDRSRGMKPLAGEARIVPQCHSQHMRKTIMTVLLARCVGMHLDPRHQRKDVCLSKGGGGEVRQVERILQHRPCKAIRHREASLHLVLWARISKIAGG